MGDENTKKRKFAWEASYSTMTISETEERIGITMEDLASNIIPIAEMMQQAGYTVGEEDSEAIKATKEEVYKQIALYLRIEGFPIESTPGFKEPNINDLVLFIIAPILDDFKSRTGRSKLRLFREKQIVTEDSGTGGDEVFVVVDRIPVTDGKPLEAKYIFIVEAKKTSFGAAMKQCLLSMKDMGDSNHGGGIVYGFVTTGESWRMLSYDGASFQVTEKMDAVFETMGKFKERWFRDYSLVVNCIDMALSNGGIAKKDAVVGG